MVLVWIFGHQTVNARGLLVNFMVKGENRVGMGINKVGVALVLLFSGDSPAVARAVGG